MIKVSYPDGIDCIWLASDMNGYLAIFITAGIGPIPSKILLNETVSMEDFGSLVYTLPVVSDVQLLVSVNRPDDFIDLSSRGFYVYDWTDCHRTYSNKINSYEKVSIPKIPITENELFGDIATLAHNSKINNIQFSTDSFLKVDNFFQCMWPKNQGA